MELILTTKIDLERIIQQAVDKSIGDYLHDRPGESLSFENTLTIDEVVKLTGIKKAGIYQLTWKGAIPYSRRGKRLYFEKSKIEAWLLNRDAK